MTQLGTYKTSSKQRCAIPENKSAVMLVLIINIIMSDFDQKTKSGNRVPGVRMLFQSKVGLLSISPCLFEYSMLLPTVSAQILYFRQFETAIVELEFDEYTLASGSYVIMAAIALPSSVHWLLQSKDGGQRLHYLRFAKQKPGGTVLTNLNKVSTL